MTIPMPKHAFLLIFKCQNVVSRFKDKKLFQDVRSRCHFKSQNAILRVKMLFQDFKSRTPISRVGKLFQESKGNEMRVPTPFFKL